MLRATYLSFLFLCFSNAYAEQTTPILDFNWDETTWADNGTPWQFTPANTVGCGNSTSVIDRLCTDKHRLFLYYNWQDSHHKGWARYGFMGTSSTYAIENNALKLTFTGGRALDAAGEVHDYGAVIYNRQDFMDAQKTLGDDLYATRTLPGAPSVYYKPLSNYDTTLGIFPQSNRFHAYVWMPPVDYRHTRYSRVEKTFVAPPKTLAWYPFIDSPKGSHYYHHATNRPSGGWIKVEFDGHPTHSNAGYYNSTHSYPQGGDHAPGDSVDYFERISAFAFRLHGLSNSPSPSTAYLDEWSRSLAEYENEETIANVGLGFDPIAQAFDISLEDKYRCGTCQASYELRYSFEPINNGNFSQAHTFTKVENFFLEDDSADLRLHKPNPYYNAIWGKVYLPSKMLGRFLSGERLYVAVKDVSDRQGFEVDPRDTAIVNTPAGDIPMNRLVKVIDMIYRPAPPVSRYYAPDLIHAQLQKTGTFLFSHDGVGSSSQITADAAYEIRAQVFEGNPLHTLLLDPFDTGDYELVLSGTDETGSHRNKEVLVKVDSPLCGINTACQLYTLADFSQETILNHREFSRIFHDVYTRIQAEGVGIHVGKNPRYNYQGIAGIGLTVAAEDVLAITLINRGDQTIPAQPSLSSTVEARPADTGKEAWLQLPEKDIAPGESMRWLIPVQMLTTTQLPRITVSIGAKSKDILLTSISLHSKQSLDCLTCGETLVDFHADGEHHLTPQQGWQTVLQDVYTGQVEQGSGIVIGSNGAYNFQGIQGTSSLPSIFSTVTVHWRNYGTESLTFAPRYSYDDVDREKMGADGVWHQAESITIPPNGQASQTIPLPSEARLLNIRNNINQHKLIALDKITSTP